MNSQNFDEKPEHRGSPLKMTDNGMAPFFAGMAEQYNPKAVPGLKAVIQFNLENDNYYLIISGNECKAYKGLHPNPTLTIITPADVWMKISLGEIDGTRAFMKKLFKVEGDMSLLMKLQRIFLESDITDESSKEFQQSVQNFDNIPDHRGPLKIPGMLWMNIAFIPWMIMWIWGTISPGLLPQIVAAGVAFIIILYHMITNLPTLF